VDGGPDAQGFFEGCLEEGEGLGLGIGDDGGGGKGRSGEEGGSFGEEGSVQQGGGDDVGEGGADGAGGGVGAGDSGAVRIYLIHMVTMEKGEGKGEEGRKGGAYTWRMDSASAVRWSRPCLMKEPSMSSASTLLGPKRLATKDLAIL